MTGQTSALQALMHLLKSYIGSGILAMPKAFSYSGIIIGCIGTPVIGLLCHTCIHMLIDINEYLCQKLSLQPMDYEELAEKVFENGPDRLQKFSKAFRIVVTSFLFVAQMGFCTTYYVFIASNIKQFSESVSTNGWSCVSIEYYLLIVLPFLVLISFIKNIKHLSIASMFGNVLQLVSFVIIIYNLVSQMDNISDTVLVSDKVPQFFSTTMFTYEGITVTMGLYRSMKNRRNFDKPCGVINNAIAIVIVFYVTVGLLGYLKYGDQVAGSITLSLPKKPIYESVQLMYSIAIFISYPIQLYVAINILWPLIYTKLHERKVSSCIIDVCNYGFRTCLVLLTYALAALIPKLDLILSLIGAISCSTVAIMIPPILHTMIFYELKKETLSRLWLCIRNAFIFLFGLLGFCIGTYFSLKDIIESIDISDVDNC
ncbi:neutral amino acid uniporter 4-like [Oppia nitens]|uniref:neutral amino acid uniporter 4-like n=1 Tax=Oppia nitens TaxID=1686743 RepID=UPI0023D9B8F4|nr:neutral amino acid uniporter 4-like [Oppia nitens]